jgi:hypothetical protein
MRLVGQRGRREMGVLPISRHLVAVGGVLVSIGLPLIGVGRQLVGI